MKKNVLVFGVISGLIAAVTMLISMEVVINNPKYHGSMWVGYGSMIVAFSLIFVGIKNLRDKFNNGFISFGKAFKTGLLIALIVLQCMLLPGWLITIVSIPILCSYIPTAYYPRLRKLAQMQQNWRGNRHKWQAIPRCIRIHLC